jgi:succinyl-diaminopimelate desuccinylase
MTASADLALRRFDEQRERILSDWFALLRYPTVAAEPGRLGDLSRCAAWLKRHLKRLGFATEILRADEAPILLAERPGEAATAPVALFYGHYDVQPADPLELWQSPPFEPELREGRVYARGAQDNKGQLFAFLEGMAALIAAGLPMPTLRVVLECQEESGSKVLCRELPQLKRRLAADVLLVCDTSMHASGRPAITAGLRGVAHLDIRLDGPARDLHSGTHGGLAPNPALGLARLLATLHHDDGSISVEGFLDHLAAPSARELQLADATPFDSDAYERETGVAPLGGERHLTPAQRASFRPTIEVNGMLAGYTGEGSKTIIPATAMAKLSARLCPGQNPHAALAAIGAHLRRHLPPGLRLTICDEHAAGPGFRLPLDSPIVRLAETVLSRLDPRGPLFVWEGASIPIVAELQRHTGAAPLLVGFGREEDRIHAPNESFSLEQFRLTMNYGAQILAQLASAGS